MKETKSYCVTNFGNYAEGLGTLRASGGDIGGGSEVLVVEPICFRPEQTIKIDGGGVAFTLESREYKSPQCVVIRHELPNDNRLPYSGRSSRQLQRSGRLQRYVGD